MSEQPPGSGPRQRPSGVAQLDQALWRQLAEATTDEEFCHSWLGLQARLIGGATGGVAVLQDRETGAQEIAGVWPTSFQSERLAEVLERALHEGKGVLARSDPAATEGPPEDPHFQLAFPLWVGGKLHGVAAIEISPRPQAELQAAMRQLQWGAAWLQNWILRQTTAPGARAAGRVTVALEMAALALEKQRFQSAATAAVTELATRLDCDRASVGFVKGGQVKVHALSHSAQFGKQMNLIRAIGGAMAESVDQQTPLTYPGEGAAGQHVLQAHEQLSRIHGCGSICTVPFVDSDQHAFGALTLERAATAPFDEETVELLDSVAALLGPILEEKRRNDRLLIVKARDSLWDQVRKLIGPRYALRKLLAVIGIAVVVFFLFATGQYRVTAKATLEGEVRRVIAAPYRGFIYEAPVRGGDIVREGDAMCSLDVRDLRLEYARWSSEREQYAHEHRRALSEADRASMNILSKKMRQAEAQLALLDEQIARATIVAPFDGVVVSGDLSQALGAPVEAGQVLFEVAPLDRYRVMLEVDESDIGDVTEGQGGHLVLTSMPETKLPFTVARVVTVSTSDEGKNLFLVQADLQEASERLRPGMEGFGKIQVERRKLAWIWGHDLIDWIRLKAWKWLP